MLDEFDPNTWAKEKHEYRTYADDYANSYAVVDEIDYQYLIQWRWKLKQSRTWAGTKKPKVYLARSTHEVLGRPAYDDDGNWLRSPRLVSTLFLHTIVMVRKNVPLPKTDKKIIVDHADSDGFNCRRCNLRYATLSFNSINRNGSNANMLFEG